jgi:hypothetical protein
VHRSSVVFLFALVGCAKPAPEAPKDIGLLGAFLFSNFEVTDETDLADYHAGLLNLRDFLTTEDMALDALDRAFEMPILDGDDLGGHPIPAGADPLKQVNRALSGVSSHSPAAAKVLHTELNQVCIESDTTKFAQRELLTDGACWLDGSCDRLDTLTAVYKSSLADVWYDQYKNYRTFTLTEEDDTTTEVVIGAAWIEDVFETKGGGGSWDQLYAVDIYIPDPDDNTKTLRWHSMWSSVTLAVLGDDLYGKLVVSGLDTAYIYGDEFIEGNIVTCTNDLDEPEPERW